MSSLRSIAAAVERNIALLRRRPQHGLQPDAAASVSWQGGLRMQARHANGTQLATDMPAELGGSGDQVTPGWLFRAGLASCGATSIVLAAAAAGVELVELQVQATSRSDARGLLGLDDGHGAPCYGGPIELRLAVRVRAAGVPAAHLHELVAQALARSPISSAVERATPIALDIDAG